MSTNCRSRLCASPRSIVHGLASFFALYTLLMLAACGGGDIRSSGVPLGGGGTGTTPTPVLSPSRFIFGGPGFEVDGFFGGTINPSTGIVTPIPGMFVDGLEQGNLLQILADPRGRFVLTMREQASFFGEPLGQAGISSFQINLQTGTLTRAPNSPIIFGPGGSTAPVFLDGLGRFVYQSRLQSPPGFDIYSIDPTSAALTKLAPSNVAPLGGASVGSPDGRFIFESGSGRVQTLGVDASGQLSLVATTTAPGGGDGPIAVSSDGTFLYSANNSQGTVAVFGIGSDGRLTSLAGAPFNAPADPTWLALTPDGKFLYGLFSSGVQGFAVNPGAGTFTPIAGFVPIAASAFTLDKAGKFAFVADINAPTPVLTTFSIDANTGKFTQVSTAPQPVTDLPSNLTTAP